MLLNYEKAEHDELLLSHVKHLKDLNGITSMMDFYCQFVDPTYGGRGFPVRFDLWTKTAAIYDALGLECGMDEFFLNTSCYSAVAPLLSKNSQNKQITDAFWRTNGNHTPHYWTKSITPV